MYMKPNSTILLHYLHINYNCITKNHLRIIFYQVVEVLVEYSLQQDKSNGMTMNDIYSVFIAQLKVIMPENELEFKCILQVLCNNNTVFECSTGHFKLTEE